MWVFGFGSLMYDGWETAHGCRRRVLADLPGFQRTFNKGSVKNWGTRDKPCPTLNLVAAPSATCKGIAFEFSEEKRLKVLAYLKRREGEAFELTQLKIRLENGDQVSALVPIYSGKNVLSPRSAAELASMARAATGENGACTDYVRNVAAKLAELGIVDRAVDDFWRAVRERSSHGAVRIAPA